MMKVASIVEQNILPSISNFATTIKLKILPYQGNKHYTLFTHCCSFLLLGEIVQLILKPLGLWLNVTVWKHLFDKSLTHSYLLTNACTQVLTCTIHNDNYSQLFLVSWFWFLSRLSSFGELFKFFFSLIILLLSKFSKFQAWGIIMC